MSWVAVAVTAGGVAGSIYSSNRAADASKDASRVAAESQDQALAYQQSVEELPLAFRDAGMGALGAQYGLDIDRRGNVTSDGSSIQERAMSSPLYTGALEAGESAIGRSASATGRLRGGATPAMLGQNAQNAYMTSYLDQLQGLGSFARTPLNTNAIAASMGGIGNTLAQGDIAAARAQQQGIQGATQALGSGLGLYGLYQSNKGVE